jgi:hypothetical protein
MVVSVRMLSAILGDRQDVFEDSSNNNANPFPKAQNLFPTARVKCP